MILQFHFVDLKLKRNHLQWWRHEDSRTEEMKKKNTIVHWKNLNCNFLSNSKFVLCIDINHLNIKFCILYFLIHLFIYKFLVKQKRKLYAPINSLKSMKQYLKTLESCLLWFSGVLVLVLLYVHASLCCSNRIRTVKNDGKCMPLEDTNLKNIFILHWNNRMFH